MSSRVHAGRDLTSIRSGWDRSSWVYAAITVVGIAAFLYPFWLPRETAPTEAHSDLAPFLAAGLAGLLVLAVGIELRHHRMNGVTVALLGMLSAATGLMRLLDLPGGGSGMFPLLILAAAAFGARFGLLLGLSSMALSAVLTGGLGPWLPFQMLGAAWMGATAGLVGARTCRLGHRTELMVLAAVGWLWGFAYGAILNLWSWPFTVGQGELGWDPALTLGETLQHYYRYYLTTSVAWDAAGATANAVVILLLGGALLTSMRRFAHRLAPVVLLDPLGPGDEPTDADAAEDRGGWTGPGPVWSASPRNDDEHPRVGEAGRSPALTRNRR